MAKKPNDAKEKAKQIFFDSAGQAKPSEIAKALGINPAQVRKWKYAGKWEEQLKNMPKKKGGQKGNKNAEGHGAPVMNKNAEGHGAPAKNRNAETHGAYSKVYFDELSDDEKALIESITLDTEENTLRELQVLIAKEKDLEKRIKELQEVDSEKMYTDRVVEMRTPPEKRKVPTAVALSTTVKSSAFERELKLEAELNKVHGRIIKLLDTIKAYELERRRIKLEEKRYSIMKQKASGEYSIDPDTGELNDTYEDDAEE